MTQRSKDRLLHVRNVDRQHDLGLFATYEEAMPTDLPLRSGSPLSSPAAQAALLSDALLTNDAFLVSRVLHDLAQAQGQSYNFGDDPALSVVLAAIQVLGLELMAKPASP